MVCNWFAIHNFDNLISSIFCPIVLAHGKLIFRLISNPIYVLWVNLLSVVKSQDQYSNIIEDITVFDNADFVIYLY